MMDVAHAPGISTGVFSPELLIPKISAREDISQAGIHMSLAEAKSVERRKRKEKVFTIHRANDFRLTMQLAYVLVFNHSFLKDPPRDQSISHLEETPIRG